jgi:hypothetical protein
MDFRPVIFREAHEGEHVGLCIVHEGSELRHFWTQLIGDRPPLLAGSLGAREAQAPSSTPNARA